jgi:hypothetical protein
LAARAVNTQKAARGRSVERNRFEETVRHFGVGASRRQLLGGLIGSTAAALAGVVVGGDAADAAKKGGKNKKTKSLRQKGVGSASDRQGTRSARSYGKVFKLSV